MTTTLTSPGTPSAARAPVSTVRTRPRLAVALAAESAVMGTVFVAYRQVRHLSSGDTGQAMDNAATVVELERRMHVFSERAVQRLVLHSELLVAFLNRYYVAVHFPATIAMLVWAFCRHRESYGRIRAAFLAVTLAALAIHVAVPLAPPRMLAGFVDTLDVYGPRIYPDDTTRSVANQFAAMPSLHFGWAVLVAAGIIAVSRSRWRLLALAHPLITLLAIVATANHYWLDAAVALALVGLAGLGIHWWSRTHRATWRDERATVRASESSSERGNQALRASESSTRRRRLTGAPATDIGCPPPQWSGAPMSFGNQSGPPASDKQIAYLLSLLRRAGHEGFRDARHPLGLTQRQAGGKFSGPEASALIERLLDGDAAAAPTDTAAERLERERVDVARGLPAEVLADELRRRGWTVAAS